VPLVLKEQSCKSFGGSRIELWEKEKGGLKVVSLKKAKNSLVSSGKELQ